MRATRTAPTVARPLSSRREQLTGRRDPHCSVSSFVARRRFRRCYSPLLLRLAQYSLPSFCCVLEYVVCVVTLLTRSRTAVASRTWSSVFAVVVACATRICVSVRSFTHSNPKVSLKLNKTWLCVVFWGWMWRVSVVLHLTWNIFWMEHKRSKWSL